MSNQLTTPNVLANAHAVASVRNSEQQASSPRSVSTLAKAALFFTFVAATFGLTAPAQAQTYQSSQGYTTNSSSALTGRVVDISTYVDNGQSQYQSQQQQRNDNSRQQARDGMANLVGSIVNSVANQALGGNRSGNYYSNQAANIGSQMAGQMASNMVYSSGTRVNNQGWDGNVRSVGEQMSILTVDVQYPNGRMERIQVRQPAPYSAGIQSGDEVSLQVNGQGNNRMIIAVETPRSRQGYRPR